MGDFQALVKGARAPLDQPDRSASALDPLREGSFQLPPRALISILRFEESLGPCQSVAETLGAAVGRGLESFGAHGAVIALLGYRGRLEHVHGSAGYEELAARFSDVPLDSPSPLADVARTGRAILEESATLRADPGVDRGPRWAVLPIAGGRGVIGALWLFLEGPRPDHEPALFAALIERLVAAIDRVRLLDSERRLRSRAEQATARLSRLQSLTTGLSSALEPAEVADAVMTYAVAELGANGGTFFMLSERGLFGSVRSVGPQPQESPDITPSDLTALARGGVLISPSVAGFPQASDAVRALVPIAMRGEIQGAIELSFPPDLHPRGELRSFLGVLGSQCSDAMDRARLYRQRAHEARVLQTSLLPRALPTIPSLDIGAVYRPFGDGTVVGGDFYDVYELTDRKWGFDLGDVSGKGVEAAAVTSMVRYTARSAALLGCGPAETLRILNRVMLAEPVDGRFCTIVHGTIEPKATAIAIRMTLGGHPRPLFVDGVTGAIRPVGVPGTAMGLSSEPELTESDILLRAGDAIAFFTDGCIDFRANGRTMSDEGPLLDSLRERPNESAAVLAKRIEEAAIAAKGGASSDDIAVLVLRRRGNDERG